jgi:hypothetical protein
MTPAARRVAGPAEQAVVLRDECCSWRYVTFVYVDAHDPHWGEESAEWPQNLPVRAGFRPSKDAQLHGFYVNLNNVRFSDDAGRAC